MMLIKNIHKLEGAR